MPSINQSSSLLTCMRPLVRLEVARLGVPLGAVGKVATVHPLPRQLLLPLQLLSMLHAPQLPRRSLQRPEVPRLRRALLLMEPHDGLRRESDQLDDGRLCVLHGGGGDGGGRGRRLLPPDDVDLAGRALGLDLDRDEGLLAAHGNAVHGGVGRDVAVGLVFLGVGGEAVNGEADCADVGAPGRRGGGGPVELGYAVGGAE